MAAATRCRAKNQSTCWKHGSGSTTTLKGARHAYTSAVQELEAGEKEGFEGYESYADLTTAVRKFRNRVLYLEGQPVPGFSTADLAAHDLKNDIYKEKVKEHFKDVILSKSEKAALQVTEEEAVQAMKSASPVREHLDKPTFMDEEEGKAPAMKRQRAEAQEKAAELEAQGYTKEVTTSAYGESWYYHKNDVSDTKSYAYWKEVQGKHARSLSIIKKAANEANDEVSARYQKLINKKSFMQRIDNLFAGPDPQRTTKYHGV